MSEGTGTDATAGSVSSTGTEDTRPSQTQAGSMTATEESTNVDQMPPSAPTALPPSAIAPVPIEPPAASADSTAPQPARSATDTTTAPPPSPRVPPDPIPAPSTLPSLGVAKGTELNAPSCAIHYKADTPPLLGTGPDPYLEKQWHLHNDGQLPGTLAGEDVRVRAVWASGNGLNGVGRGRGIRIAVVDDGLEVTHPDLWPNIVPDGNYNYRQGLGHGNHFPMPCASTDVHGTAVAGLIAARDDNGIGVSGVAPRASLVGLNALASGEDRDILHAITYQLDRNHVYHNSWGAVDTGQFQHAPAGFGATIGQGLKHGRGGLGAIYVFSGGNGGCLYGQDESRCQGTDLSTYDSHVTQLGTIAVCATDAAGQRPFYGEPGANLLVCAPSAAYDPNPPALPAITTTALQGKFTPSFGGTSASAPMVSGVIALMLEANPQLSWRDVRLILARSARQVNPHQAGWTHFGGLHFHHEYGFGVVDAEAAVRLARQWTSVGGSASLKRCEAKADISLKGERIPEVVAPDQAALAYGVPAEGGLTQTFSIPTDCDIQHVEHVQLTLTTGHEKWHKRLDDHPDNGNLHITLTSPAGQTSTVATPHPCYKMLDNGQMAREGNCGSLQNFSTGLSRHLEEPAVLPGNPHWLLKIVDRKPGDDGRLMKATLTLYGR